MLLPTTTPETLTSTSPQHSMPPPARWSSDTSTPLMAPPRSTMRTGPTAPPRRWMARSTQAISSTPKPPSTKCATATTTPVFRLSSAEIQWVTSCLIRRMTAMAMCGRTRRAASSTPTSLLAMSTTSTFTATLATAPWPRTIHRAFIRTMIVIGGMTSAVMYVVECPTRRGGTEIDAECVGQRALRNTPLVFRLVRRPSSVLW